MSHFWEMNQIDKTQFPFPYAQVTKLIMLLYINILPFVLQPQLQNLTEIMMALIAMGFYGLDEVAEILESPFGDDPNDVDLKEYGYELMTDLELIYKGRDRQLDTVFDDEHELEFNNLLKSL